MEMTTRIMAVLSLVIAIAGCAKEPPLPNGVQVKGPELREFLTGTTIRGYNTTRNMGFVERYHPGGRYDIALSKSRESRNYGQKYVGTWRIENDRVCYKVPALDSDGCAIIYDWYSKIEFVSPETGKVAFYSSDVEREEKKAPPVIAAAPAPSTPSRPTASACWPRS